MTEKVSNDVVLVTGSKSLIGQHVIKHLQLYWENLAKIKTFDQDSTFENRLNNYETKATVETFCGSILDSELLQEMLQGVTTVIHLLEIQDFSMFPNTKLIWDVNFKGTELIVSAAEKAGVKRFVFGSSMLVMMSNKYPSVFNPETTPLPDPKEYLFPDYCKSKVAAENVVGNSVKLQTFVIRQCLMYGEGDRESGMFHAIQTAKSRNGVLPILGDGGGVIQYAYAGNVAWGVIHILRLMVSDPSVKKEVIFLPDATPVHGFYNLVEPFLKAGGYRLAEKKTPWLLTYLPYVGLEKFLSVVSKIVNVSGYLRILPSSSYLMAHYHFWYFFSGFKARVFLDYQPLYSYEKAVQNCESYYASL